MFTAHLVGILLAVATSATGMALFFARAWRYQREDVEYLLFGAMVAALVPHTLAMAAGYYRALDPTFPITMRQAIDGAVLMSKLSLPLTLHFALRHQGSRHERRIMIPLYALMAAYALLIIGDMWWLEVASEPVTAPVVGGLSVHVLPVRVRVYALSFYLVVVVVVVATIAILARVWLSGRRGSFGAFAGAVVLGLTVLNDSGLGAGWWRTVPLVPIGEFALAYGVALTLVDRYGRLAVHLEERTSELGARSRQLEASYRELQAAQQELVKSEQLAIAGELAAVVAHQVRNPLAIVSGALESLRKENLRRDDRPTLLGIVDEELGRLDSLASDLRAYAQPVSLQVVPCDLLEVAKRCLWLLDGFPNVDVTVIPTSGAPAALIDEALVRHACENVLTNAVEAMGGRGALSIEVSASHDGEMVEVVIMDDGPGMTPATRAQALSPFFTTRPTGTGLGLAIVERIVIAHKGVLDVDTRVGAGATVRLSFPAAEAT